MGGGGTGIGSSTEDQIKRAAEREAERLRALNDAQAQEVNQSTIDAFNNLVGNEPQASTTASINTDGLDLLELASGYPIDHYDNGTSSTLTTQPPVDVEADADAIITIALGTDCTEAYAQFQSLQMSVADPDVSDAVLADSRTGDIIDDATTSVRDAFDDGAQFAGPEGALEPGLGAIDSAMIDGGDAEVAAALMDHVQSDVELHVQNARIELYEAYEQAALALDTTDDTAHRGYIGRGLQQLEQDIVTWQNS